MYRKKLVSVTDSLIYVGKTLGLSFNFVLGVWNGVDTSIYKKLSFIIVCSAIGGIPPFPKLECSNYIKQ